MRRTGRGFQRFHPAPVTVVAALALCALSTPGSSPLAAQRVTGWVVDAATADVLAGVRIELLEARDAVARTALSDEAGRFTITAPRTGRFRLRAERIGYAITTSEPLWLSVGDTTVVRLDLPTEPLAMAPLTVLVAGRRIDPVLDRNRFYDREELYGLKMGAGVFFGPEQIEKSMALEVTDILRKVIGVRVRSMGGGEFDVTTRHGAPLPLYINGVLVRRWGQTINDLIAWSEIGAIEVYSTNSPVDFGGGPAILIWLRSW